MRRPIVLVFVLLGSAAMAACPNNGNEMGKCQYKGQCDLGGQKGDCVDGVCCFAKPPQHPGCPNAANPFRGKTCQNVAECAVGGADAECTANLCCYPTKSYLPQEGCDDTKPFLQISSKAACDPTTNKCATGGDCKNGKCCFEKKEEGPDENCDATAPFAGIKCPNGDADCAKGGTGGKCSAGTCCYKERPTAPELSCSVDVPFGEAFACAADADCKKGTGGKCMADDGVCCYTEKDIGGCPAANAFPSKASKKCKDDKECTEDGRKGVCHNDLCCYDKDVSSPTGGPGSGQIPPCPANKPQIRQLCVNGQCSEAGDVCYRNYACCYSQDDDNNSGTTTVPTPQPELPRPRPTGVCRDLLGDCQNKEYLCSDRVYETFMAQHCPKTCNTCQLVGTFTPQPPTIPRRSLNCQDANLNCPTWVANGFCSNEFYTQEMKRRVCGSSCGLC